MAGKTIEVIIPVQNMADHLPNLLQPILDQLADGDVVTVVDDASTDGTERVARALGANVVTLPKSQGPYYARHIVASRSAADILLFVDGRCRPLPGLLDAHRELQARPGVALSCTDVRTLSGPSLAARMSAMMQPFRLPVSGGAMKADSRRPDYYPTANLGIDRTAFVKVGGFRAMRGGGDTDICWRIQEQSLGTMAVDSRVLMEWEPRTTMRDLASQWTRYGRSNAYLRWVSRRDNADERREDSAPPRARADMLATVRAELRRPVSELVAFALVGVVFQYGYVTASLKRAQFVMPVPYGVGAAEVPNSTE